MKRRTVWVVRDEAAQEFVFSTKPMSRLERKKRPCGCGASDCRLSDKSIYVRAGRLLGKTCEGQALTALPFLKRLPANTPVRVVIG